MRIEDSKIVKEKRGEDIQQVWEIIFMKFKVQLDNTKEGFPIASHFTPGNTANAKDLEKIIDKLPFEATIYGNSANLDYGLEDAAF